MGYYNENTKVVVNRLSRSIGHLESVKKMLLEGRDYNELLIQISAVRASVNNIGKIILKDSINHCIADAVKTGDKEMLDEISTAIDRFIK